MEIFGLLDPDPHENLCGSETLHYNTMILFLFCFLDLFGLRARFSFLPWDFLHYDTMILQRIRIIVEDAGIEPGTFAPEVWCALRNQWATTSPHLLFLTFYRFSRPRITFCTTPLLFSDSILLLLPPPSSFLTDCSLCITTRYRYRLRSFVDPDPNWIHTGKYLLDKLQ